MPAKRHTPPAGDGREIVAEAHGRLEWVMTDNHARSADDGSVCAVATEDDAEWVADGVSKDPEACLTFTWYTSGAKGK